MRFEWKLEKNAWLREHGRISFKEIVVHLGRGDVWKTSPHPNPEKYPHQSIALVIIDEDMFLVPFDVAGDVIHLRTQYFQPQGNAAVPPGKKEPAMKRPTTRLNQHEKEIIQAFDRDELVLHDPTPALLAGFAEAAENTTRKDRRINIRLSRIVRPMALPQPLSSL